MGYCNICLSAGSVNKYGFCEICGTEHKGEVEKLLVGMTATVDKDKVYGIAGAVQGG